MAADGGDLTFALPDLSGLSEAERLQVFAVIQRAKEFEEMEKGKNPRPKMEGQLLKYTNVMKGWQTRWFLLEPESGMLEYFEKEEYKKQRPRGCVHLAAAVVSPSDEDSQTFTVTAANGEAFKLRASDARERQHWVDRLRSTAEYHTANIAQNPAAYQRKDSGTHLGNKDGTPKRLEASQTLNKSIEENLPRRQAANNFGALPAPFIEVQEYLSEARDYSLKLSEKIAKLPYSGVNCFMTGLDRDLLMLKATSGATISCIEQCLSMLQGSPVSYPGVAGMPHSVSMPVQLSGKKPPPMSPSLPVELGALSTTSPTESYVSARSAVHDFEGINHAEEEEDVSVYIASDLGGVEEHKSVILHLLSQVKLGMDLTKVVLPTFILERRSLLEMFADCMAHPDQFLKITNMETPEKRMLMLLEWYLSSFHAGRQGSVAKKPYNPVIGETFHCSWQIPEEVKEGKSTAKSKTKQNLLVYCAEQVSHHPPVSAFYFECPEKKMCMNGSIWTKSKFMGMSIGVVMVGKVCLRLLEHDEEYVFGLPSAYARSILTVPWVELGDKLSITCEKTNLSASIVFHTKPFYGGKLHRVTAELKNNLTGALLCKVNGEWNNTLEFTYADGSVKVIDTHKLKKWPKRVRPLTKQGELESRRLWQHVTNALNVGNVETATEHKRLLEERQREGEHHRQETRTKYKTKFFHEEGECWVFNKVLGEKEIPDKKKSSTV